jgi:hypothetical protein
MPRALGAGYTCDFVCDFMCDLLHIADAIWCICDLVSDKNHFLSFCLRPVSEADAEGLRGWLHVRFRVRFHVRFGAYRRCDLVYLQFGVRQESLPIFLPSACQRS